MEKNKKGTSYATNAINIDISSMIVFSTKIKRRNERRKLWCLFGVIVKMTPGKKKMKIK